MIKQLALKDFLAEADSTPVIDVRTPAEFEQGRILHAHNIPLFSNEDRILVGTTYKQQSREAAILQGFELVGGKWATFIKQAEAIAPPKKILVHCWRGGMRSNAMAWALNLYGFEVGVLTGGYKAYRQNNLKILEQEYPFIILGGMTGSAKTQTLAAMKDLGEQVIDLEELAKHQGSSFGSMGKMVQPSQEYFENSLASELSKLNLKKRIWLEDESVTIGKRVIPKSIFQQMRQTHVMSIDIEKQKRIDFLNEHYGCLNREFLKESINRISKRFGPEQTKFALQAVDEGRIKDFIALVLVYYDKTYSKGQKNRATEKIHQLQLDEINFVENAKAIIDYCNNFTGDDITQLKTKSLINKDNYAGY